MKSLNILLALLISCHVAFGQCPNGLTVAVSGGGVLNCAQTSVPAIVSVTGGVPPYTYWWGNGVVGPQVVIVSPGVYCVTVTDAAGCTAEGCVTVTQDVAAPLVTITGPTELPCGGGSIVLTSSTNQPALAYQWTGPSNFASTSQNATVSVPGTYMLVVTNSTGCTSSASIVVTAGGGLPFTLTPASPLCNGDNSGSISIQVSAGTAPYTFATQSTGGGTVYSSQIVNNLGAGAYSVTVTDATGLSCHQTVTVTEPAPFVFTSSQSNVGCGSTQAFVLASGGTVPYTYLWDNGNTAPANLYTQPGPHFVTITDANGCQAVTAVVVNILPGLCDIVLGKITRDTSQNCAAEPDEPGLANWIVEARKSTGEEFYALSDSMGNYLLSVLPGSYAVRTFPPGPFWEVCQPDSVALQFSAPDDTLTADFTAKAAAACPQLFVQISSGLLRRCLDNNYFYLNFCNLGAATAEGAAVTLTLDPLMTVLSATVPYTNLGNDQIRFDLGDVAIGECGNIFFQANISCDAVLGQTLCVEAAASATNDCPPTGPLLSVTHECGADSLRFFIENEGNVPISVGYVVIEDAVMLTAPGGSTGTTTIQPGGVMPVALPKNGDTWRLEANILSTSIGAWRSVEGCGSDPIGSFSTGYVNLFNQDPSSPVTDVFCGTIVGSYDPNDKSARPEGFGAAHFTQNGTPLEYKIRFQNTGTDTAFNVSIRDTLDANLDPSTFRPGAASHPFTTELLGAGVVVFHFKDILLPDSFVNESASHGFVEFSIKPKNMPDGTVIKNRAGIFFDLNDPVITNEVFHTIGTGFVPTATWFIPELSGTLTASPNPFFEQTTLDFGELKTGQPTSLRVFDTFGKEIRRETTAGSRIVFERKELASGLYLLLLENENGQPLASGKLVVR